MRPIDTLCVNSIRSLSIDSILAANSGHPGLPLGAAPMAYTLWQYHLKQSPSSPEWMDRDRFILSAGHGSMLLYSLLYSYGYGLEISDLRNFRQWKSKTPGHPEFGLTSGVEATTGPLGQGTANAVGMAMAERFLADYYNRPHFPLIDHRTYALVSDGDLMEGISAEACSLAGQLQLGKLIFLYDSNDVTLDGPTSLCFDREDVGKRFESYGWQVLLVKDGDQDLKAIDQAIQDAKEETLRPTLIEVKTTIGFGSPKAGSSAVHGAPLNETEILKTKEKLGISNPEPFHFSEEALDHFRKTSAEGDEKYKQWNDLFTRYQKEFPDLAKTWKKMNSKEFPLESIQKNLPKIEGPQATRKSSGKMIQTIAKEIPWLLGGDADLSCSTNTLIKISEKVDRNIHYGVREHAMAGIANGMGYHTGPLPFVATFFCFSDYMKPSIRLAAMNHLQMIYVWTHDSIGLGEDGPTHQPIEHLMALRAVPNLAIVRPADEEETQQAWVAALNRKSGPTGIVLSRQTLPHLPRNASSLASLLEKGAYILSEPSEPLKLILMATGSEVCLALEAQKELEKKGTPTRVVSFPCWEFFEAQPTAYKKEVFPPTCTARISIEAGSTLGWQKWVGDQGISIGIDRFGASAPGKVLMKEFGFSVDNIVQKSKQLLNL